MAQAAEEQDDVALLRSVTYGGWDAHMVRGCACDPGWGGFDCSLRQCPLGDDPLTTVRASLPRVRGQTRSCRRRAQGQDDDVQLITCVCDGVCTGGLTLYFRGHYTPAIPHDAEAADVATALQVRQHRPAAAAPPLAG